MTFFFKCVDKNPQQHVGEDEQQSHHTQPDEKNMPSGEQAEHNGNGDEDQRECDKPERNDEDDLCAGAETGWGWFGRDVTAQLHFNIVALLRLGRRSRFLVIGGRLILGTGIRDAGVAGVGEVAPTVTPAFGCTL